VLYLAPPSNSWWSQNELLDLYEKKSGKTVKPNLISKEALRSQIEGEPLSYRPSPTWSGQVGIMIMRGGLRYL